MGKPVQPVTSPKPNIRASARRYPVWSTRGENKPVFSLIPASLGGVNLPLRILAFGFSMIPEMRAPTTDLIRMRVKGKVVESKRTDCLMTTLALFKDKDLSGRIDFGMT